MGADVHEVLGVLGLLGVVLLFVMLVSGDSEAKPADNEVDPAVRRRRWEVRVQAARRLLDVCLPNVANGEKHYQEAERRLATPGSESLAVMEIEQACIYRHWRALLHLAVIRAMEMKPQEAIWAFDKAVLVVNPAGIEPDDFRPKMVGMALIWLEARPGLAKVLEDSVSRRHPGISGAQLRAKAVEEIIETIPPLKP
ncbi:hypothetical protein [Nonomuraea sp. NPDC049725]|uniref:hypothetical protein n=1 Tax=Nonomuraea sp. NPDC049725 TaxID=3154508 RepID=UPI00343EE91D